MKQFAPGFMLTPVLNPQKDGLSEEDGHPCKYSIMAVQSDSGYEQTNREQIPYCSPLANKQMTLLSLIH